MQARYPELASQYRQGLRVAVVLLALAVGLLIGGLARVRAPESAAPSAALDPARIADDFPLEGHNAVARPLRANTTYDQMTAPPQLDIPASTASLTVEDWQSPLTHTFEVHNNGSGTLYISRLYTGCACMTAHLSSSVIPPGQVALLTVAVEPPPERTACALFTAMRRGVFMETNDPARPQAMVWLEIAANCS
ncbi:MAG: hypothetical protein Kow0077_28590 [Anaerolineae bacterium]